MLTVWSGAVFVIVAPVTSMPVPPTYSVPTDSTLNVGYVPVTVVDPDPVITTV